MVVPRFGRGIVGGAETLFRGLADHIPPGWRVEVATTCATNHLTWTDDRPPGRSVEDGLTIHRFPVSPRDERRHTALAVHLSQRKRLGYGEELELLGSSVTSERMEDFIDHEGPSFDLMLFGPYLFGTTYWGSRIHPDRSALIPCLHDEPYAHMTVFRDLFAQIRGCMFNTPAEARLAARITPTPRSPVVGLGFDPPARRAAIGFAAKHGLGRYVVYAGRLERAKGVDRAIGHVARFAQRFAPDLRIVLMGRGDLVVPPEHRWATVELGYVDEETKRSALAEATALINPSDLESLSIVVMESWLEGTPVIVSGRSEVLVDHVAASGGGVTFTDAPSFETAMNALLDSRANRTMGEAGREYVHAEYSWDRVSQRFGRALDELRGASSSQTQEPIRATI